MIYRGVIQCDAVVLFWAFEKLLVYFLLLISMYKQQTASQYNWCNKAKKSFFFFDTVLLKGGLQKVSYFACKGMYMRFTVL